VQEGDTIEIQYVDGRWDCGRDHVLISPDNDNARGGDRCALVGQGNIKLANLPSGTKDNPYKYRVEATDAENLYLKMDDTIHSFGDNTGSVRYSVRIIPAGGQVSPRAAAESLQHTRQSWAPLNQPIKNVSEVKTYTVSATDKNGTPIGLARAGDIVEIQYVSGKWSDWRGVPVKSPDDFTGVSGDNRLRLCKRSDFTYVIAVVPGGTKEHPFRYTVDEDDAGELAIRINDRQDGCFDNVGSVRYSVKIISAERATTSIVGRPIGIAKSQPMHPLRKLGEPEVKVYTIPAGSADGVSIGIVQAGDTIEIQYLGGKWSEWCTSPVQSPDAESGTKRENRLRLCKGTKGGQVLSVIPGGTRDNPFRYMVDEDDAGKLVLRINDPQEGSWNNIGSTRYSVKIIPKGKAKTAQY
jgi:hypothetical protein